MTKSKPEPEPTLSVDLEAEHERQQFEAKWLEYQVIIAVHEAVRRAGGRIDLDPAD